MSTLNVTNVQSDTYKNKSGTREYGRCTAWVNFNGTGTVAIRDSLNVSSIIDNGVGLYTVNFSQAMSNTNYSIVVAPGHTKLSDYFTNMSISAYTVSSVSIAVGYVTPTADAAYDRAFNNLAVFGGE
jgi:hypothetical protein